MAMHVVFQSDDKPPYYLIGSDGSTLVRVLSPSGSIGEPQMMASLSAHMVGVEWSEYKGSAEEEQTILVKAQAAIAEAEQRKKDFLARKAGG